MSKWYRLSLSLAAKCRFGFAFAVLIIISAGLFVPYRWMDKLVEQGKLELAQTEVEHVFQRHFSPVNKQNIPAQIPSLNSTETSGHSRPQTRWIELPGTLNSDTKTEILVEIFPDDTLLRQCVKKFLKKATRREIFEMQKEKSESFVPSQKKNVSDKSPSKKSDWMEKLMNFLPWDQPARYFRAVRADTGCLIAGCHTSNSTESVDSADNPVTDGPHPYSE